jgi:hypothetical protein
MSFDVLDFSCLKIKECYVDVSEVGSEFKFFSDEIHFENCFETYILLQVGLDELCLVLRLNIPWVNHDLRNRKILVFPYRNSESRFESFQSPSGGAIGREVEGEYPSWLRNLHWNFLRFWDLGENARKFSPVFRDTPSCFHLLMPSLQSRFA